MRDAESFAYVLKETEIKNNVIQFGNFHLNLKKGVDSIINYNNANGVDLLNNKHEYTFNTYKGKVELSLQLYENISYHYRLFAFTRIGNIQGMTFSINLTTQKESNNVIYLIQKIKFSEQSFDEKEISVLKRRQKQVLLCEIYRKIGLEVTENNDLILGIFDPIEKKFINTSAEIFMNNFIAASILKGHFQGNKGYELDIIPNYHSNSFLTSRIENNDVEEVKLPEKILTQKKNRIIPLAFRYQILKRDNSKCVVCGRGANDGVILHIDHKIPFSLGGLTVLDNLQTLCSECNISKSNRFVD